MNYIKQLQAENKSLNNQIENVQGEINNFISFLHSDKFSGQQSDGERKDWIATSDVLARLREMRFLV